MLSTCQTRLGMISAIDSRDACLLPDELFVREINVLRGACVERIPGSWLGITRAGGPVSRSRSP